MVDVFFDNADLQVFDKFKVAVFLAVNVVGGKEGGVAGSGFEDQVGSSFTDD